MAKNNITPLDQDLFFSQVYIYSQTYITKIQKKFGPMWRENVWWSKEP